MKNTLKRLVAVILVAVMAVSVGAVSVVSASATSNYDYTVKVKTSNKFLAGTDADVYLYAYDENNNLIGQRIPLNSSGSGFEKGDTDTKTISLSEKIATIKVGTFEHVPTGDGAMFENLTNANDWHLDYIQIIDSNGNTKTFSFNCWIEAGHYSYTETVRDRGSFPINKTVYVPEEENLYTPQSVS